MPESDSSVDQSLSSWDEIDWEKSLAWMTRYAERALNGLQLRTGDVDDVVLSAARTRLRQALIEGEPPPEDTRQLECILRNDLKRKVKKLKDAERNRDQQTVREGDTVTEAQQFAWVAAFARGQPTAEDVDAYTDDCMQSVYAVTDDAEIISCAELAVKSFRPKMIAELTGLSEHQVRRRLDKLKKLLEIRLANEDLP